MAGVWGQRESNKFLNLLHLARHFKKMRKGGGRQIQKIMMDLFDPVQEKQNLLENGALFSDNFIQMALIFHWK